MLNTACKPNGSLAAVEGLVATLTDSDYQQLTSFAAKRLRYARGVSPHADRLGSIEPADLVHHAVLKALLGEAGFPGGWQLTPEQISGPDAFRCTLQSIINSTAIALARRTEFQTEHVTVGDPSTEPGAVDPANREDTPKLLELTDLRRIVFEELRKTAAAQPQMQRLIQRWEDEFLSDHRFQAVSQSRYHWRELRSRMQKVLQRLAREITNGPTTGKEILL